MTSSRALDLCLMGRPITVLTTRSDRDELERAWSRCLGPSGLGVDVTTHELADLLPPGDDRPVTVDSVLTGLAVEAVAGEFVLLHACGLSDRIGRVAALVGPSGAGKSTAAAHLGTRFGYVSDEVVAVRPDGSVVPFPRPLSLAPAGGKADKRRLAPDTIGLAHAVGPVRLSRLILLDRSLPAGRSPTVEPLSLVESLLEVVPHTSYLLRLPLPLHTLAGLLSASGPVRVSYTHVEDLFDVVGDLLTSDATPLPWTAGSSGTDDPAARWALCDGRIRRRSGVESIEVEGRPVLLVDDTPVVLDGIGTTIWAAAADSPTTEQLLEQVIELHGPHPDAGTIVRQAMSALHRAGAIGFGRPERIEAHRAATEERPVEPGHPGHPVCPDDHAHG